MSCSQSLGFHNATVRLRTIRIEPWARHFLLGPDEKLAIIARATGRHSSFRIVEANDTTLIYTEGCDDVCVLQDGTTHHLLDKGVIAGGFLDPRKTRILLTVLLWAGFSGDSLKKELRAWRDLTA